MKLKLTAFVFAGLMASMAYAQDATCTRATCTAYEKACCGNWFVTFQGGVSILGNGDNAQAKLPKRLSFTPSLALGKWHNPFFATRLKLEAGEVKSFMKVSEDLKAHKNYFAGLHYDFMLDVVNFFSQAPGKCPVALAPFVGLGYEYKFDSSEKYCNTHAATAHVGLQLGVRLSQRVDFILEGQSTWNAMPIRRSYPTGFANNLRHTASAGLSFRLGKVGFTPMKAFDESLVAGLNEKIAALRAENAELAKRPVDCPDIVPVAPIVMPSRFLAEKSVLFAHGKSIVSKDQLINLFDASEFVKKHQGELVITGYIQKSETRFKELARKRAEEVAGILVRDYGVASEKITVEYKEATVAPFDAKNAAWNRVVVIRSK